MRRSKTGRSKWLQRDWQSEIKAFFKGYWSEKKKKERKKRKLIQTIWTNERARQKYIEKLNPSHDRQILQ